MNIDHHPSSGFKARTNLQIDPLLNNDGEISRFREFQEQAEKAINLVPALSTEDKVRAILLWNILSTKLQTIINEFADVLEHNSSDALPGLEEFPANVISNQEHGDKTELEAIPTSAGILTNAFEKSNLSLLPEHVKASTELPLLLNESSDLIRLEEEERALEKVVDEVITLESESENLMTLQMQQSELIIIPETLTQEQPEMMSNEPRASKMSVTPAPNLSKTISWSCLTCAQVFEDVRDYEDHVKTAHVKPKQYKCAQCPRSFSTRGNLNVHIRNHTGEKPFGCTKCCASFTSGGNLRRHLLSHQGLKPYRCSTCDSCFTEKKSLIVHQRSHSGERPFKCSECSASFSQNSILKSHLVSMHSLEKAHGCSKCGKKFKQKSHLRVHEQRHSSIKKHGCTKCSATFVTSGDLSRHLKSHAGIKSFTCETCGKGFMRPNTLKEHMNRCATAKPVTAKP